MSVTRACSIALLLVAACVDSGPDADLGESTQAVVSPEGQGWQLQGADTQGWQLQGWQLQGWQLQGGSFDNQTLTGVLVNGTAIEAWRTVGHIAEQRLPNKICNWNSTKTINYGCTTTDLRTSPSPLAGVKLTGTFKRTDGSTFQAAIRIGSGKSDLGAVTSDSKYAMFKLDGNTSAASCGWVPEGTQGCAHPAGCRKNCDVWLYKLWFLPPDNKTLAFCPGGNQATAVAGTYSANGTFTPSKTGITLACTNGTIAKCTRWGYRSWGSARKHCFSGSCAPNNTLYALRDYHQSCIRAAMADYCTKGVSFTRNGTLVDISDMEFNDATNSEYGFVPETQSGPFVFESRFDKHGAREIDYLRYQESSPTIASTCDAGQFSYYPPSGSNDILPTWLRTDPPNLETAHVRIASTTGCSHSELTVGKWLHPHCSLCAALVPAECNDPAHGWDSDCVQAAKSVCTSHLTSHSECNTGTSSEPLDIMATGCTLSVCSTEGFESCCTTAWTSTCVNAAKSICKGGQEGASRFANFCSPGIIVNPLPLPPTTTNTL